MSLQLPNLDDKNFDKMMAEVFDLLPRISRGWTNRNVSDPGIMLLELFAALIEVDIYQINRVSLETYRNFLRLVGVDVTENPPTREAISLGVIEALRKLETKRAISLEDIVQIADSFMRNNNIIARSYVFPDRDFTRFSREREVAYCNKDGHILVIVVPDNDSFQSQKSGSCDATVVGREKSRFIADNQLVKDIKSELLSKRVLTNRIHIHRPVFIEIRIEVTLIPEKGADYFVMQKNIENNLYDFYCPVYGGEEMTGYSIGRAFKTTEAIERIEASVGVDYITNLAVEVFSQSGIKWVQVNRFFNVEYFELIFLTEIVVHVVGAGGE
jgi:hypothetical protein